MNGKRSPWLVALGAALASCLCGTSDAAPPWGNLISLNRVEADPEKDYLLNEENGPWMIMACSFSGEHAQEQARELALELRKRYKLPAYVHRMRFDLSDVQARGIDRYGFPIKARYRRSEAKEIAVLVGNYPSIDDPQAQKTLRKLWYSRPMCLELDPSKPTARTLAGWRLLAKHSNAEDQKKGPMGKAFITKPLLPEDSRARDDVDPEVIAWNEGVPYSLLDCPGRYTVQVATFKGNVVIEQSEIQAIKSGKKLQSRLIEAAQKANELTEALRQKGWEAYQFHDRHASIVTVGGFDSMGTPRADGRLEINPAIHQVMRTFAADQAVLPGHPSGVTTLKSLIDIPFDIQPVPIHVPRRSISRELARERF